MQISTEDISPVINARIGRAPAYSPDVWQEGFLNIARLHSAAWSACLAVDGITDGRSDDSDWDRLSAAQTSARELTDARMANAITGAAYLDAWILREEIDASAEALRRAVEKMLECNLRLCAAVATKSFPRMHMPVDDRMQHAALGCLRAIRGYDPTRGIRFSTYATFWIKHAIRRADQDTTDTIRIPVHVQDHKRHILKTLRAVEAANGGRRPGDINIAVAAQRSPEMVALVAELPRTKPMAPLLNKGTGALSEERHAADTPDLDEAMDDERRQQALHAGVAALRPLVRTVIERRLGLAADTDDYETCEQIAAHMGVSKGRVQTLAAEGIRTLHVIVPALMVPPDRRTGAQRRAIREGRIATV